MGDPMRRGVLLGDRSELCLRSRAGWIASVWLPVGFMLLMIWRESTDGFSSAHTGTFLRPLAESLFGQFSDTHWETVHHVLRKTGHFLGYGTLGVTWLRAWLLTWQMPLRRVSAAQWWRMAWQMAICCTAAVAAIDELHQTWIPSRTGLVTDVLLDSIGALVCTGIITAATAYRPSNASQPA